MGAGQNGGTAQSSPSLRAASSPHTEIISQSKIANSRLPVKSKDFIDWKGYFCYLNSFL